MGVRASLPPAAILCSISFATCFVDVEPDYTPTPPPYGLELSLSTPLLEPLQFYLSGFNGMGSPDTTACLRRNADQTPVFTRSYRFESSGRNDSGDSCESEPSAESRMVTYSWPDLSGGTPASTRPLWQVQKFRPFSGTLHVHGNSGRLTSVSIALDDQAPAAEFRFSTPGGLEMAGTASKHIRVTPARVEPIPLSSDDSLMRLYDFFADLRIEVDTTQLVEGTHRLDVTVESPEISGVRRSIRENDRIVRTEFEPASTTTYSACFEVLLNATSIKKGPDGALWIGTFEGGLVKADLGKSRDRSDDDVITFLQGDSLDTGPLELPESTGDLAGNMISRLAFDPQGNLWVGTLFHDFSVMREGAFSTKYDTPDVDEFEFDMNMLTISGGEKLTRYVNQELSDTITGFAFLSNREVMIATLNGLYYLNHQGTLQDRSDDRWVRFDQADGLADANLIGVEVDKTGLVWIATTDLSDYDEPEEKDGEGIYVLDMKGTPENKSDDRWANFTPEEGKFDERVLMFAQDADGGKWLGAIGGLFYLDDAGTPFDKSDDQWAKFGIADGFIDEDISSIYFQGGGQYLVGAVDILTAEPNTPPGGALITMQLVGMPREKKIKSVVNYTIDDGFMDADVSSIEIDKFRRVAFSSFNFFHSPLVTSLYSTVELKPKAPASQPPTPPPPPPGRDGVSFIDLGPDEENKADDQIVNLVPKRIRIKGKRL